MSLSEEMRACALEPFTFNYAPFYAEHGLDIVADVITASVWTVSGGAGGTEFIVTPKTTIFLSGGVLGTPLVAENVIEINGGIYKACGTLYITIT